MVSRPSVDPKANFLRRVLPAKLAYAINRWWRVLFTMYIFSVCRRKPEVAKKALFAELQKVMGPDYDLKTHFTPRYNPWEQRLCLVPDGDLFQAIKAQRASVVTDEIESFTATGLKLKSGSEIEADLVVTATGLNLQVLGGLQVSVDGAAIDWSRSMSYKGLMFGGVPNFASAFGYTNASWTLKCDLTCEFVCRLLNHMQAQGQRQCTPRNTDPTVTEQPWIDFSSGYVQRSMALFPKQGSRAPWKAHQNYARDIMTLRYGTLDDGAMVFSNPG